MRLQKYFQYRGWNVAGVFVSEGERKVGSEQIFDPDMLTDTDGIVVALGEKHVKTVVKRLKTVLTEEHLFIPDYK